MTLLFANNAYGTLAGPITSTATTLNLAAGTGAAFPNPTSPDYFKLTLVDAATGLRTEICHVTARSTDTLTVVRAREGTQAQNWLSGDLAQNLWTAGSAQVMLQSVQQSGFFMGTDTATDGNNMTVPTVTPALSAPPTAGQIYFVTKGTNGNTGPLNLLVGTGPTAGTNQAVVYGDGTPMYVNDVPGTSSFWLYYTGSVYVNLTTPRLNFPGLPEQDVPASPDVFAYYDVSAQQHVKIPYSVLQGLFTPPTVTSITPAGNASFSLPGNQTIPVNNPTTVIFTGTNPSFGNMNGAGIFHFTKAGFYLVKASITLQQSNVNNPDYGYFGMHMYQNQTPSAITNTSNTPYIGAGQGAITYSGGLVSFTLSDSYIGQFAVGDSLFVMGYTDNVTHNAHNPAVIPQSTLQILFLNS